MALHRYRVEIDYFSHIAFEFESYEYYIRHTGKLVKDKIDSAEGQFDKHIEDAKLNPQYGEELMFYHDFDYQTVKGIKDIFYDSIIINIYSLLERKLYFLANGLSANEVIKLDDIAGNGIFKYKKYLMKVCKIDFSKIKYEWEIIENFNKLRNKIVHSEGKRDLNIKANINDKAIKNFLNDMEGVSIDSIDKATSIYHFENDYILYHFLNNVKVIVDHLYIEKVS